MEQLIDVDHVSPVAAIVECWYHEPLQSLRVCEVSDGVNHVRCPSLHPLKAHVIHLSKRTPDGVAILEMTGDFNNCGECDFGECDFVDGSKRAPHNRKHLRSFGDRGRRLLLKLQFVVDNDAEVLFFLYLLNHFSIQ